MNVYIGTKIVVAWRETKNGEDGYAVRYDDGYLSWSPKAVFERCYRPLIVDEVNLINDAWEPKHPSRG